MRKILLPLIATTVLSAAAAHSQGKQSKQSKFRVDNLDRVISNHSDMQQRPLMKQLKEIQYTNNPISDTKQAVSDFYLKHALPKMRFKYTRGRLSDRRQALYC